MTLTADRLAKRRAARDIHTLRNGARAPRFRRLKFAFVLLH
jgi:hypothetical protein